MLDNRSHIYHPFQDPFLGFSISKDTLSRGETGLIIDDIDLYSQPLEHPAVVIVFFAIRFIVVLIGEMICTKILKRMKKESSTLDGIMKLYIITLMIHHPFRVLYTTTIATIHPVSEVIGIWFCYLGRLLIIYNGQIVRYNSFITALIRYFYMVHNGKVVKLGKEKLSKVFLRLNIGIPLLFCALDALLNPEVYVISSFNKCYGIEHKVFLLENPAWNLANFGASEQYEYYGVLSVIVLVLKLSIKVVLGVIGIIMALNISEGIIYYTMFSNMNR